MSSFLQEKLQRERQAESQRSNSMLSASNPGRTRTPLGLEIPHQASPVPDLDLSYPESSDAEFGKRSYGVKGAEEIISKIHKEKFDLQLKIQFHEERQEQLQDQLAEAQGINDDLLKALEKRDSELEGRARELNERDRAIEEAVAMIISLEAKNEQLVRERDLARRGDARGLFDTPDFSSTSMHGVNDDDSRAITRVPSFISDRTENTEHLRNVYLRQRSSVISLAQVQEPAAEIGSPSLSVLSESSFVSIYGHKDRNGARGLEYEEPLDLDANNAKAVATTETQRPSTARTMSANSIQSNAHGRSQRRTDVLGQNSPLQRLEKLDPTYSRRPQSSGRDISALNSAKNKSPSKRRAREDQAEPSRKGVTDTTGAVRSRDMVFPPTPDTISTSTLHRFRKSSDTVDGRDGSSGTPLAGISKQEWQQMPITRSRGFSHTVLLDDVRHIQRPRSADETTISHRRDNDWISDSEDNDDAQSLQSSLDIWIRQGSKQAATGRVSPDLFGFPTTTSKGGWSTDAMFGPGNKWGEKGLMPPSGATMDDLISVHHVLFSSAPNGPPPPNRRSSLHAATEAVLSDGLAFGEHNRPKRSSPQRTRHSRTGTEEGKSGGECVPVKPTLAATDSTQSRKGHQYPPISNQSGARAGFNRFIRRSLGGSGEQAPSIPVRPASTDIGETTMGTPSWVTHRGIVDDDDRAGATPPPIMRNPRVPRLQTTFDNDEAGGGVELGPAHTAHQRHVPTSVDADESSHPHRHTVHQQQEPSSTVNGHGNGRRKWLPGFGRSSSLRNKTG